MRSSHHCRRRRPTTSVASSPRSRRPTPITPATNQLSVSEESRCSTGHLLSQTKVRKMPPFRTLVLGLLASFSSVVAPAALAQEAKPNILVIMGHDIGYWNISAYNRGQMGYRTPNIDRIANEGAIFTDYYGQQSCTAGRPRFIT